MRFIPFLLLLLSTPTFAADLDLAALFKEAGKDPKLQPIEAPSRVLRIGTSDVLAATGQNTCGLQIWEKSNGDVDWSPQTCVMNDTPAWIKKEIPDHSGGLHAPDLVEATTLLYSASGTRSCLGRLTRNGNQWIDSGGPLACVNPSEWPFQVSLDSPTALTTETGRYLVAGRGVVHGAAVDMEWSPVGDMRLGEGPWMPLARGAKTKDGFGSASAPFLHKEGDWFYLFVTWGTGTTSPQSIRVGRSSNPLGPFIDKNGVSLLEGGGTLFLESFGPFENPTEASITLGGFGFQIDDRRKGGLKRVADRGLKWENEWPELMR